MEDEAVAIDLQSSHACVEVVVLNSNGAGSRGPDINIEMTNSP